MSSFYKKDSNWLYNPSLDQLLHCSKEQRDKVNRVMKDIKDQLGESITVAHTIQCDQYLLPCEIHYLVTTYHNQISSDIAVKCLRDLEEYFKTITLTYRGISNELLRFEMVPLDLQLYHQCLLGVCKKVMEGHHKGMDKMHLCGLIYEPDCIKKSYNELFGSSNSNIGTISNNSIGGAIDFNNGKGLSTITTSTMPTTTTTTTPVSLKTKITQLSPITNDPNKRFKLIQYYIHIALHLYLFDLVVAELRLTLALEYNQPNQREKIYNAKEMVTLLSNLSKTLVVPIFNNSKSPFILKLPLIEFNQNHNNQNNNNHNNNNNQITNQNNTELKFLIFTNDGVVGFENSKKKFTLTYKQVTIRNQIYGDSKRRSKHLLLIGVLDKNTIYDEIYTVDIASVDDIMEIYHSIIRNKGINLPVCENCNLPSHEIKVCDNCNANICLFCTRVTSLSSKPKCIDCFLVDGSQTNVRLIFFGNNNSSKYIRLTSTSFVDFTSKVFKALDIDKGMNIRCKVSNVDIPLNNDINLHMALRSPLYQTIPCKTVQVSIVDPIIDKSIPIISFNDIEIDENDKLGEGGGGSVFGIKKIVSLPDLDTVPMVLKQFSKEQEIPGLLYETIHKDPRNDSRARARYKFKREASILSMATRDQCKYIVKMYGFCKDDQDPDKLAIVLERAPMGTISRKHFTSWKLILLILLDVAEALIAIHKMGYIFQDLKPDNVLMYNDSTEHDHVRCKLSDFGITTRIKKKHYLGHTGVAHTDGYSAPEHSKEGHYNESIDIYAFGLLTFELVTGGVRCLDRFSNKQYDLKNTKFPLQKDIKTFIQLTLKEDTTFRVQSMDTVKQMLEDLLHKFESEHWEPPKPISTDALKPFEIA